MAGPAFSRVEGRGGHWDDPRKNRALWAAGVGLVSHSQGAVFVAAGEDGARALACEGGLGGGVGGVPGHGASMFSTPRPVVP